MKIQVSFGILSKPPSRQVRLKRGTARHIDRDAEAISRLLVRGLLSDSEALRARKRLMKRILRAAENTKEGA